MATHRAERARLARPSRPPPAELARLPIHFFAAAVAFFAIGVAAVPWMIGRAADYFYQPDALAGTTWLVVVAVVGIGLARTGADSVLGNRLAGAYGVLGVLGWVSNFIVGMSYQLFPGFVVRVRAVFGWPPVTIAELSLSAGRPLVFICLNAGVLALAGGLLAGPARGGADRCEPARDRRAGLCLRYRLDAELRLPPVDPARRPHRAASAAGMKRQRCRQPGAAGKRVSYSAIGFGPARA